MSDSQEHAGFLAPDPADLAPLFPGYKIQGLIATGGMGAVYSAVQRSLDRTVALKILPMEFSKDAAFCAGFEAEAKAMGRLNHPNLIGVFDFGEVNGMLYIIMEFVPGKSLYHSSHGIAIAPSEVIRIITGVCNGLAHAHENGILHRDIKPSNILLDLDAQPKIGDFGLARPIERKIEEGEEIFGTPHYTAPEVVNSPHSVDYRADLFSVGVMLHELLTGKLPADDPRPASTIVRCDSRFDAIIRRATQAVPVARYSSAREIAADLHAIETSLAPKGPRAAANPANAAPRNAAVAAPRRLPHGRAYPKAKKSSSAPLVFFLILSGICIAAYAYYMREQRTKSVAPPATEPVPLPQYSKKLPGEDLQSEPDLPPIPKTTQESRFNPYPPVDHGIDHEPWEGVTPAPAVPVEPKYNVEEFFARARKIMQDRAAPLITSYHASVRNNFSDFEAAVKRQVHKMKLTNVVVDKTIEKAFSDWRDESERMPKTLKSRLKLVEGTDLLYQEYLRKESGIDDNFHLALSQLGSTYIVGLQKQIDRLKSDNDSGAISLIEGEIAQTKRSPDYFESLILKGE